MVEKAHCNPEEVLNNQYPALEVSKISTNSKPANRLYGLWLFGGLWLLWGGLFVMIKIQNATAIEK